MTLLLIAVALSMDAFAAALSHGASVRPAPTARDALRVGLAFGAAQGFMPLVGWGLGIAFSPVIREVDHWVAFVLLGFIGARMVREGLARSEETVDNSSSLGSARSLFLVALATSIDAAAAGVTLPFLDQPVPLACAVIGMVTLIASAVGVQIGRAAGMLLGKRAELAGGIVLFGIGTKILIEHLFFGG